MKKTRECILSAFKLGTGCGECPVCIESLKEAYKYALEKIEELENNEESLQDEIDSLADEKIFSRISSRNLRI